MGFFSFLRGNKREEKVDLRRFTLTAYEIFKILEKEENLYLEESKKSKKHHEKKVAFYRALAVREIKTKIKGYLIKKYEK